tara:strand:+ start:119 stop:490 length:372 start_codon:yes stop_codon:yes gene_type:complete
MVESRNFTTDTAAVVVSATSGGASANLVYVCPPNHDATIDFLHISNGSSSTKNVTIQWFHADTGLYHHILNDKSIPGKDVYNVVGADRIHLHAGDKIGVFYGVSGTLEAFISVRQFYNNSRNL